jgi:hypothetical protein
MQLEEMKVNLADFKADSKSKIKLEIICGDFNTDPMSDLDNLCRESEIFMTFKDTMSHTDYGTCIVEQECRHESISTPQGLKKAMQVWTF